MTIRHSPNTPVLNNKEQALFYYHWLVFCNGFTWIEASGIWGYELAGSDGRVQAIEPTKFYASSGPFLATHTGMYLAISDPVNPINNVIARITSVPSTNVLQLEATTNLNAESTGVNYRIIDPNNLPGTGNYFVIQNPVTSKQPPWQAKINVGSNYVSVVFAPIGGWDVSISVWNLPVCDERFLHNVVNQSFMVADPEAGWVFLWTEDTGAGTGANRKGVWFGSLSPFHAPRVTGAASDINFGAVFGDSVDPTLSDNISPDTTNIRNICVGQTLDSNNVKIPIYWAQKRFLGSGTDVSSLSLSSGQNPNSGEIDDYDVIAFQKTPYQAFRGRVPGMRMLNTTVVNRTLTSGRFTYVLDNGIGLVWDNKVTF